MSAEDRFASLSLDALKTRRDEVEARIQDCAARLRAIIAKDLPRYFEREARKRWLEHAEFSTAMDDAALKAFKDDLRARTTAVATEVDADLSELSVWLTDAQPEQRKLLEANRPVWLTLQKIACQLSGLLAAHGFPPDAEAPEGITYDLVYRTPAYFIDGEYCPSIIESYWGLVEEHAGLAQTVAERQETATREALAARWNSF